MITTQITFNDFWTWLNQNKDSGYYQYFSYEAAKALFEYLDDYFGGDTTPDEYVIDNYNPVAWCVEFTEYNTVAEAYKEHYGDASDLPEDQRRVTREQQLEYFTDNTMVIELDNGGIVIQDF